MILKVGDAFPALFLETADSLLVGGTLVSGARFRNRRTPGRAIAAARTDVMAIEARQPIRSIMMPITRLKMMPMTPDMSAEMLSATPA